jgi:hypothetical protein
VGQQWRACVSERLVLCRISVAGHVFLRLLCRISVAGFVSERLVVWDISG